MRYLALHRFHMQLRGVPSVALHAQFAAGRRSLSLRSSGGRLRFPWSQSLVSGQPRGCQQSLSTPTAAVAAGAAVLGARAGVVPFLSTAQTHNFICAFRRDVTGPGAVEASSGEVGGEAGVDRPCRQRRLLVARPLAASNVRPRRGARRWRPCRRSGVSRWLHHQRRQATHVVIHSPRPLRGGYRRNHATRGRQRQPSTAPGWRRRRRP